MRTDRGAAYNGAFIGTDSIKSGLQCGGQSGEVQSLLFPPVASVDRCAGSFRKRSSPTQPVSDNAPFGDISTVNAAERQHSCASLAHDLRHSQSGTTDTLPVVSLAGMDFRNTWHVISDNQGLFIVE